MEAPIRSQVSSRPREYGGPEEGHDVGWQTQDKWDRVQVASRVMAELVPYDEAQLIGVVRID